MNVNILLIGFSLLIVTANPFLRAQNWAVKSYHPSSSIDSFSCNLYDVTFTDKMHGYVVGSSTNGAVIGRTIDGGDNWMYSTLSNLKITLNRIAFVNSSVGFAVGSSGTIIKTTDSGINWFTLYSLPWKNLIGISILDSNRVFVIDEGNTLYQTTDGGSEWESKSIPCDGSFKAISFGDSLFGMIALWNYYQSQQTSLMTTDGGKTWLTLYVPGDFGMSDVKVIDEQTAVLAQNRGWIFYTSDQWNSTGGLIMDKDHPISRIAALDKNKIIAMDGWSIYFTKDCGINWNYWPSGQGPRKYGLSCLDTSTVILVGEDGIIIKSSTESSFQQLYVDSSSLSFPDIVKDNTSYTSVSFTNISSEQVTIRSVSLPENNAFKITNSNIKTIINPNETITLTISCNPHSFGTFASALQIVSDYSWINIPISVNCPFPVLISNSNEYVFKPLKLGESEISEIKFKNKTINTAVIDTVVVGKKDFVIQSYSKSVVNPNDSVIISVRYNPQTSGSHNSYLSISSGGSIHLYGYSYLEITGNIKDELKKSVPDIPLFKDDPIELKTSYYGYSGSISSYLPKTAFFIATTTNITKLDVLLSPVDIKHCDDIYLFITDSTNRKVIYSDIFYGNSFNLVGGEWGMASFNLKPDILIKPGKTYNITLNTVNRPGMSGYSWGYPWDLNPIYYIYSGGVSTRSDSLGNYSFVAESQWSGKIRPFIKNYRFVPDSIVFNSTSLNLSECNFTLRYPLTISGTILKEDRTPLHSDLIQMKIFPEGEDVSINTDSTGAFSFKIQNGWAGSIKPYLDGYKFKPDSIILDSLHSDIDNCNFIAKICSSACSISGIVRTDDGRLLKSVLITLGDTATQKDQYNEGPFTDFSLSNGSSWPGHSFFPQMPLLKNVELFVSKNVPAVPVEFGIKDNSNNYIYFDVIPISQQTNWTCDTGSWASIPIKSNLFLNVGQGYVFIFIAEVPMGPDMKSYKWYRNSSGHGFRTYGSDICAITDSLSKFKFIVPSGWSGTIKPFFEGYKFTPDSISFSDVTWPIDTCAFIATGTTSTNMEVSEIPIKFSLDQNYPNPFNPTTTIKYALPTQSSVRLVIYNVLGQVVKELINTEQHAGYQSVVWNANVSSGIYFYRLESTSLENPNKRFVETKKMLLLR